MKPLHRLKRRLYLIVAWYFRLWSNISLKRWNPRIIVVTGSVGKTTMLHLIEEQLRTKAHYSHLANSAYGISFDIVGLRGITGSKLRWLWLFIAVPIRSLIFTYTQPYYIVEVDGERPKEADFIAHWLKPEVTVWVSAENSHAVYFDTLVASGSFKTVEDAIAYEFASLARQTTGLVIIDDDNPRMKTYTKDIDSAVYSVHLSDITDYTVWPQKTIFRTKKGTFTFTSPLPKEVGLQLEMLEKLLDYLDEPVEYTMSDFKQPVGRSTYLQGIKNTQLIDSSYNAHLSSMSSMLSMFEVMKSNNKWVILGDMIEQGESEIREHKKLADILVSTDFDRYILVGKRMNAYVLPVLKQAHKPVMGFVKTKDSLPYINTNLNGGETILIKGSQYLEWVVEKLLRNPADKNLLARQEPASRKRRAKWGLI